MLQRRVCLEQAYSAGGGLTRMQGGHEGSDRRWKAEKECDCCGTARLGHACQEDVNGLLVSAFDLRGTAVAVHCRTRSA